MVAILVIFKRLGFRISDPFQNPDYLQTNLFFNIQIPEISWFIIPTVSCPEILVPDTSKYSRGSNSEHSNSESIQIPNFFMFCIRMVRFSNGPF